jgi:hypothetical protein
MLTTYMYSVPQFVPFAMAYGMLRQRLDYVRARDEGGYSTEAIVITGGLVLLAAAVLFILYGKVTGTATNINTDPPAVP